MEVHLDASASSGKVIYRKNTASSDDFSNDDDDDDDDDDYLEDSIQFNRLFLYPSLIESPLREGFVQLS